VPRSMRVPPSELYKHVFLPAIQINPVTVIGLLEVGVSVEGV
jgi:hypothetical protein